MLNPKHKSVLSIKDKSVVFKSGDVEESWSAFVYLKNAMYSCHLLSQHFKPQKIEEYIKETSGDNALPLAAFRSKKNQDIEELEQRKKIKVLAYRGFIKKFGISPLNFKKIFNAMMFQIWNIDPYFSRYCYNNRGIDEATVQLLHKNISLIKEASEKNKNNIIPFVLYSGVRSSLLPGIFGKDLWDSLSKNSHTRNHFIARRVKENLKLLNFKHKLEKSIKLNELKKEIIFLNKLPSTLLKQTVYLGGEEENKESILALLNCLKINDFLKEMTYSRCFVNDSFYTIIYQTIKNSKKLNKKYCLSWTKDEWNKKYKEYESILNPKPW